MKYFLLLLFASASQIFLAQAINVQYFFAGQITNYETGKKEGSVTATLTSGGKAVATAMTATNGKYNLSATMPAKSDFQIIFSKPGFVSKRVAYNFASMNTERLKEGEKLTPNEDLSLEIFAVKPGVDFSFLEREPVATFGLNAENTVPMLDIAASQRIKQKIEGLLANPTPQPDNADANYNSAIKSGDNLFGQKKYEEALKQYENAAGIKPKEFYPQKKIAEIDALLKAKKSEVAAVSEIDKQYNNLIAAADNFRDNKQYSEAVSKYNAAMRVKYEQYPKDEIKKIEALVADARKEERDDASYQEAIAAADVAFNAKNYKIAKERYEAAIAIKEKEPYPKSQLLLVEKELQKIADELAKQKKYDDAIAEANQLFGGSKFVEAKAKYTEASVIMPADNYPKEKIKACDEMIAKNAKSIQDAADIKRLFEEGQKLIDTKSYTNAKSKYKEILQIDPKTNLAQIKLDEIDRLIKADEDAKNADKIVAKFISDGDAAVKDGKYDEAKMKYGAALEVKEDTALREKYNALLAKIANKQAKELVDEKFEQSMKVAKALLDEEKLEEARLAYIAAGHLDESRNEPKLRVAEIDARLTKKSDVDKAYRAIIDKGDAFMKEEKYLKAIDEYNKALLVRPSDKEPKEKADEAERLERAKGDVANEQFEKIISVSRTKIDEADYDKAAELLNRAISLRSQERKSDRRPEQMLEEIEKLKKNNLIYVEKVAAAEKLAGEKQFDKAILKFEEALAIKSTETLPSKRIEELRKAQREFLGAAEKENMFNENFAKGTAAKTAKTYELALENFQKALSFKPNDQSTKDQINEINQIIEERKLAADDSKNQREKMAGLLKEADALFNISDWGEAKRAYERIVAVDKDQAHANARIKECDLRLLEEKTKLASAEYNAIIASAETSFEKKDFLRSKELFLKAKGMRPKDVYPTRKLAEIEMLLNPVIVASSSLETLGDVYVGNDGESDLMQADLERKNDKDGKFSAVVNESIKQREKYSEAEKRQNFETKDAIGNAQSRGEKEALLAQEQLLRKNESLTKIRKANADVNDQNGLFEQADNHQAQEKINYIQDDISKTNTLQSQAYQLNALKSSDNVSRINSMNDRQASANQDYQIESATKLTKTAIQVEELLTDEASRLAMQAALEMKRSNTEDLTLRLNNEEFKSNQQTTESLNELRQKTAKTADTQNKAAGSNNKQIKAVDSKMQDEQRKAYNHEMEIYLQTKESINTQEKVGIRKANEADDKTDLNNLNIKYKRIEAEDNGLKLEKSERLDNQNSQIDLANIQSRSSEISSDYGVKQEDNKEALKIKRDVTLERSDALAKKAVEKNLEVKGNIETLVSEREASDSRTIDKQLKNAKMVNEVQSVAATQAKDNAKRTQNNQRELTKSLNQVDADLKISKPRNTLGDEFPEGVTEQKFSQNGADGKLSKIITRRIVVVDGHGEVYVRTQMKGVSTYTKNNESITQYTWQKETQSSSLVRH